LLTSKSEPRKKWAKLALLLEWELARRLKEIDDKIN